ncbi:MAG: ADP-ribosylglycohydrolase family protein [Spirochaetales bacterium]|nr:ADP-ribosylglycohydrolase family protein [Spirochaetales bacterium]MCF7938943.1 ADP-ribosylglycohydrolase family protein [Spirochaetales bacterium]
MNDSNQRKERIQNALWGLFAGDALAMPAHWYYSLKNLARDFDGGIKGYAAPPHPHPEAFMVGMDYRPDVKTAEQLGRPYDILHEHVRFYDASYNPLEIGLTERESEHGNPVAAEDQRYHYHHGLEAGENTLAAGLVRVLMQSVVDRGRYEQDAFLSAFVDYMSTPGKERKPGPNRDPYTEIYLRHWFENYSRGIPPYACADFQRRVWSIGSHGGLIRPLVLALAAPNDYQAAGLALEHHNLTHRSENNLSALSVLAPLLRSLAQGAEPLDTAAAFARNIRLPRVTGRDLYRAYRGHGGPGGIPPNEMWRLHTELSGETFDLAAMARERPEEEVVLNTFATACYPEHGVPLLLYLAARHDFEPEPALLANANAGGDNVHRAMVLGLLIGAARPVPEHLRTGLRDHQALAREIEAFSTAAMTMDM